MKRMLLALVLTLGLPSVALATGGHGEPQGGDSHGVDQAAAGQAGAHAVAAPHINWFALDYDADKHENPPLAFMIGNFLVLLIILYKFAGPKVGAALRDRHDGIKEALEEGARLRAEAQQKLEEYNAKISNVDKEVKELVSAIREQAEAEKQRILAQASAQAATLKSDAEDRIAATIERSRRALEVEVVTAAIAAAEGLLRGAAKPDDQARIVDGFLASMKETAAETTGAPEDSQ